MGILYSIPTIGKNSGFGQKGPTCWYYAAKMLLKFHDKYNKSDKTWEQMKTLHELRKVLTENEISGRNVPSGKQKGEAKNKLDERELALLRDESNFATIMAGLQDLMQEPELASDATDLYYTVLNLQSAATQREGRVKEAIETLHALEIRTLKRWEILSTFVPDAGFTKIPVKTGMDRQDLEAQLNTWGPFYAGGALTAENPHDTGIVTGSGEKILGAYELDATSAHAVVVAGISSYQTVYYKDPNKTDELRSIPFSNFIGKVKLFIAVNCNTGTQNGKCVHIQTQTMSVP